MPERLQRRESQFFFVVLSSWEKPSTWLSRPLGQITDEFGHSLLTGFSVELCGKAECRKHAETQKDQIDEIEVFPDHLVGRQFIEGFAKLRKTIG